MIATNLATLLVFALWPLGSRIAAEVFESAEVIVVTGRQPGPPLWKVSSGENVLWIFPYLSWIPKDMIWESERVERVIAQSQEILNMPEGHAGPSALVRANPINIVRNERLQNRLERSLGGGTEPETLTDVVTRLKQMWLDAAANALGTNASTFAILPISELLAEDGLLSRLKVMGYEVTEP